MAASFFVGISILHMNTYQYHLAICQPKADEHNTLRFFPVVFSINCLFKKVDFSILLEGGYYTSDDFYRPCLNCTVEALILNQRFHLTSLLLYIPYIFNVFILF